MPDDGSRIPPAFYAAGSGRTRRWWSDWWLLLHPPYTLWHLSYVAIGGSIAPKFDGGRLTATLLAFLLAVGVGAHALDELHGRPLGTAISTALLVGAAAVSLTGAVAIGIYGLARVGPGLGAFIIIGVALNLGYNLELLGGRLHNDFTFALAWGAFPVFTAYYAQAETLRPTALAASIAAYWLSIAQRSLSTPARSLRRRATAIEGTITYRDGVAVRLDRQALLAPLERALRAATWGVAAMAVALVLFRSSTG